MKAFPPSPGFRRDPFADDVKQLCAALAALVREWRVQAPLSISELARRAHLSRPAVSFLESKNRDAAVGTLWRLGRAMERPSWELLREAEWRAFGP